MRRSMSTKRPESGRFDQVVSAVTWKRTMSPSPRLSAVTIGVPSTSEAQVLPGEVAVGLGQDLATDADLGRDGKAEERAFPGEGRERARRVPGERAAEAAPAPAQAHGDEIVAAGGREPRSGKAQEEAAALDEGGDLGERLAVEAADIGEDEDRKPARR